MIGNEEGAYNDTIVHCQSEKLPVYFSP